jgi:hypothetical protein
MADMSLLLPHTCPLLDQHVDRQSFDLIRKWDSAKPLVDAASTEHAGSAVHGSHTSGKATR